MRILNIALLALMIQMSLTSELNLFNFTWIGLLKEVLEYGSTFLPNIDKKSYPYFNIFPKYHVHLKPTHTYTFASKCFQKVEVTVEEKDDHYKVHVNKSSPKNYICTDTLFFGSWEEFKLIELKSFWFSPSFEMKKTWDIHHKGIGLFDFEKSFIDLLEHVVATAEMFGGVLYKDVPKKFKDANVDFLEKYTNVDMKVRNVQNVDVDVSQIRTGDTFHIRRFDGLDPMISWAMGSATGHMTIAVKREGVMMVCESQAQGEYWPINGIQCNKYEDWVRMAREAQYMFVWAPIDRSIEVDEEALNKFIDKMLGVDYGYEVLLTGWLDFYRENFPCRRGDKFPKDQSGICLEAEFIEYLFTTVERYSPEAARIWTQAMANRVQMNDGSPLHHVYKKAAENNISSLELFTIPEDDNFIYKTTRFGKPEETPVMICHEFVCQALRAGNVFSKFGNPEFNCNESSLFDIYKLSIFEKDFQRPQQCVDADPENPLCQLGGEYELRLDTFRKNQPNYNFVEPVAHNWDKCPSMGPEYIADPQC